MNSRQHSFSQKNLAIFFVLLLLAGCDKENETQALNLEENTPDVQLKSAGSKSEFEADIKTYFTQLLEDKNSGKQVIGTDDGSENRDTNNAVIAIAETAADASSSISVSTTNLVESGVDEADLVKSDGQSLFIGRQGDNNYYWTTDAISGDDGITIEARPVDIAIGSEISPGILPSPASIRIMSLDNDSPSATPLTTIKFPQRVFSLVGLYLSDYDQEGVARQLITITQTRNNSTDQRYFYSDINTWVIAYDVSDPSVPTKQWEFEVAGNHHSSRSMNGKLYLISSKPLWIEEFDKHKNEEKNSQTLIDNINIDDILPNTWVDGVSTEIVKARNCMVPENAPDYSYFGASLLSIYTIPIGAPENTQSFCTLESSSEIYASNNAIYFTKGQYVPSEKPNEQGKNYTVIHKLTYTEDSVAYQSSTRIPGYAGWRSRSFRMSERNNDLRIVVTEYETVRTENANTTVIRPLPSDTGDDVIEPNFEDNIEPAFFFFERRPVHRLYVLREDVANDNKLSILSQLPNKDQPKVIGKPGEEIYAVRYFGDYAYIVTFRNTDPLYAINLADPTTPFIEGELEIPGFSDYLHPINNDLLLGIGKEANEDGQVQGIKIALFDVSDKNNPTTLKNITLGQRGSNSAVNYDYLAFSILQDAASGIHKVALPVSVYDTPVINEGRRPGFKSYRWSFSGLQLLEIDDGSQSNMASMIDAGTLKSEVRSKDKQYHYVQQARSVIANDAVHYIENAKVWSALWDNPSTTNGPE